MSEDQISNESKVKEFVFPVQKTKGITIATVLFFQILYTLLFLPFFPYLTLVNLSIACTVYLLISLLFYSILILSWPEKLLYTFFKITIDDTGIYTGIHFLKWGDLGSVKHGVLWFKTFPQLSLLTDKKRVKFWTFKSVSSNIRLSNTTLIYSDIVPLIKKYRPDIPIPSTAEKILDRKEKIFRTKRILIGLSGILQITFLVTALIMISNTPFPVVHIFGLLVCYSIIISQFSINNIHTDPDGISFLRSCIYCVGISFLISTLLLIILLPPFWIFKIIILINICLLVMGLIYMFFIKLNSITRKVVLFSLMTMAATTVIYLNYLPQPTTKNISSFFNDYASLTTWGKDGKYLAEYCTGDKNSTRFVIDMNSIKKVQIPVHKHCDRIRWMNSSFIIRRAEVTENVCGLFLYNFQSQKEIMFDKGEGVRISSRNPLSPDQKQMVWMTRDEDGLNPQIKLVSLDNLSESAVKTGLVKLPKKYKWFQVDWLNQDEIIIQGTDLESNSCNIGHLVLYQFNLKTSVSKLTVSKHKAESWYPTANFKYAFTKSDNKKLKLHFIHFETDEAMKLSGKNLPSWIVDQRIGFRTVNKKNGKTYFCEFDLINAQEIEICTISDKLELAGVSSDGRYAIFAPNSFLTIARYHILDVKTKKWHKISLQGFSFGASTSNTLVLSNPNFSIFSPNTNIAIFETHRWNLFRKDKTQTKVQLIDIAHCFETQ